MTFDLKYRPRTLDEMLGSSGMKRVLGIKSQKGTIQNRSYLFGGPKGCGKTTIARWVAKAILCKSKVEADPCNACDTCKGVEENQLPGFDEIDAAVSGSVERIREIISDAGYLSLNGDKRIVILDEAHRLNAQAQDVLLKALEDRVLIALFCTTEPEKIRPAIRTRLEEYHIKPPLSEDLIGLCKKIIEAEDISTDESLLPIFVERCGNCPRVVAANLALLKDLGGLNTSNLQTIFDNSLPEAVIRWISVFGDKAERIKYTAEVIANHNPKTFLKELVQVISFIKRLSYNIPVSYPLSLAGLKISDEINQFINDCLAYPEVTETSLTFLVTKDYKSVSVEVKNAKSETLDNDKPVKKSFRKVIEIDGIKYNSQEKLTSLDDKIEVSVNTDISNPVETTVEYINLKVPMTEREFGREYIRRVKA